MSEIELTAEERRAIESMRTAHAVIGGEPLVPFDVIGMAREIVALRERLSEARLYGEKMLRDRDDTVRGCGADLLGIIDARGQ